ncbi:hypothetical protein T12_6993 [Trichinella patagoniensis]|uniref:Uncharacterized protein n=1 Tax=Trichinella patagoniensis TaxID=990121 RepID=A0A0V0ZM65_9BILA|nr:hypothetical protein T12_6993 [Trichinella patagoniensis]
MHFSIAISVVIVKNSALRPSISWSIQGMSVARQHQSGALSNVKTRQLIRPVVQHAGARPCTGRTGNNAISVTMSSLLGVTTNEIYRHASEQQPMKFYCEKVGGVRGEIGSTPLIFRFVDCIINGFDSDPTASLSSLSGEFRSFIAVHNGQIEERSTERTQSRPHIPHAVSLKRTPRTTRCSNSLLRECDFTGFFIFAASPVHNVCVDSTSSSTYSLTIYRLHYLSTALLRCSQPSISDCHGVLTIVYTRPGFSGWMSSLRVLPVTWSGHQHLGVMSLLPCCRRPLLALLPSSESLDL